MSLKSSFVVAMLSVAVTGSVAMACDKEAAKTACSAKAAPALATAVSYRVGDIETPCAKTAAAVAERDGLKVGYVAAGETYDSEAAAKSALAQKIDAAIEEMLQVRYVVDGDAMNCPMSAGALAEKTGKPLKYRAVGHEYESIGEAQEALARAQSVLASYKSGCCASSKGAALASATEVKSGCSASAKETIASAGSSCSKGGAAVAAKSSCSSAAKETVASAGSSCCKSGAKTVTAKSSCSGEAKEIVAKAGSTCTKSVSETVANACPETEKADAALAAAKARYEAVLASVNGSQADKG